MLESRNFSRQDTPKNFLSSPEYLAALGIVRTLRSAGHQAYLAGGCVRDLLLGVTPKDYDVATSATPEQAVALFPKTFAVGAHFGVILVCTSPSHLPGAPEPVLSLSKDASPLGTWDEDEPGAPELPGAPGASPLGTWDEDEPGAPELPGAPGASPLGTWDEDEPGAPEPVLSLSKDASP